MSIIFGAVTYAGTSLDKNLYNRMVQACSLWPHDRIGVRSGEGWFLACKHQYNTPQAPLCNQPVLTSDGRYQLVFDGRIDNRMELAFDLKINLSDKTCDEDLILGTFSKYGTNLGNHLIGDFAIAIFDKKDQQLYLIRDHMGVRPLFIARCEHAIAFASVKAPLLELPWVDKTHNKQWIADLLAQCKVDYETTIYSGINTLRAAHWLISSSTQFETTRYWQLNFRMNDLPGSADEHVKGFTDLLKNAIQCRLRSFTNNASELSGGLDSTTITSIASQILNEKNAPIHAFSHVMAEKDKGKIFPFKDESSQIKALCHMRPNIWHNKITSENYGIIGNIEKNVRVHSGPSRNDLTLYSQELFTSLQNMGIRTLLSGFGGDQLVTSKGSGWELELITQGDWKTLWDEIQLLRITRIQKIKKFLRCRFPIIDRARAKFSIPEWDTRTKRVMSQQLAHLCGYPAREIANPTRKRNGTVREREHDVIHSPHLVYRLEDSAVGAAVYGVDYRYPLLDIRLLQFCLDLPTNRKISQGVRRKMIRESTKGLLPEIIRTRDDKSGSTIPTVFSRFMQEQGQFIDLLSKAEKTTHLSEYANIDTAKNYITNARLENQKLGKDQGYIQKYLINVCKLGFWLKNENLNR